AVSPFVFSAFAFSSAGAGFALSAFAFSWAITVLVVKANIKVATATIAIRANLFIIDPLFGLESSDAANRVEADVVRCAGAGRSYDLSYSPGGCPRMPSAERLSSKKIPLTG